MRRRALLAVSIAVLAAEGGSRWQAQSRTVGGFTVRHPPGL